MVYFKDLASAAPNEPLSSKFKLSTAPVKEPYFTKVIGSVAPKEPYISILHASAVYKEP